MLMIGLKMLIADKAKFIGMVLALSFASFIIVQQAAIFVGLMARTCGFIADTSQPDIYVMDRKVQFVDDIKPLKGTQLFRVRGIEGVRWAVPLYKGLLKVRLAGGNFQICNVIGIDAASLIGGPPTMLEGTINALRLTDGIIVNREGADDKLAVLEHGCMRPLMIGDDLEINDHRASVVGICQTTRTFQSQPVIYTTYARATSFAPFERKLLSFILVKAQDQVESASLCRLIEERTGLAAYTGPEFKKLTIDYYLKRTGIPLNFGIAVALGFVIGIAIASQTFYNFTLDNLCYLATFKVMGASNSLLTKMVLLQASWVGFIGWGLGIGTAALFGFLSRHSQLSFLIPWQLYLSSMGAMLLICMISAAFALRQIYRLDPTIVFTNR